MKVSSLFTSVLAISSVSLTGLNPAARACDGHRVVTGPVVVRVVSQPNSPQAVRPKVSHVQVSHVTVASPCNDQVKTQRIEAMQVRMVSHVDLCRQEALEAEQAVENAARKVLEIRSAQDKSLGRLLIMREWMEGCGSHILVGDLLVSKNDLAAVIECRMNEHEGLVSQESRAKEKLIAARAQHQKMVERLAKWQRQQSDLISRIDNIRTQQMQRRQAEEAQHQAEAIERAITLVTELEAQFNRLAGSATNVTPVASPTTTPVTAAQTSASLSSATTAPSNAPTTAIAPSSSLATVRPGQAESSLPANAEALLKEIDELIPSEKTPLSAQKQAATTHSILNN